MSFHAPSDAEIREIVTNAPFFEWPTFDHMPLNCFDLTAATITFPGDISQSRVEDRPIYADYKININDLNTCPKEDAVFECEIWNEESTTVPWFFGRMKWTCLIDAGEFVLHQGVFRLAVAAMRFQNIEGVSDLTNIKQLKHALFSLVTEQIKNGDFQPIHEDTLYVKVINDRPWVISRSLDQDNNPIYRAVTAIDFQTVIFIPAALGNSWFRDEIVPEEVEQKHMASFWDFLAHIHLNYTREEDLVVGSIIREAPGQAEKIDDLPEW
ncbi:MAG: hypothetical protein V4660_05885 [Pseudomonadota bacterium]